MPNDPNGPAGEAVSGTETKPHEIDMEGAFANLAHVVSMMHWFTSENMQRAGDWRERAPFQMRDREANQLFSLLYVADYYADGILAALDGRDGKAVVR